MTRPLLRTTASDVFAIDEENASAPYYTSNFPVDTGFLRVKNSASAYYFYDRLRQNKELVFNTTAAAIRTAINNRTGTTNFTATGSGSQVVINKASAPSNSNITVSSEFSPSASVHCKVEV